MTNVRNPQYTPEEVEISADLVLKELEGPFEEVSMKIIEANMSHILVRDLVLHRLNKGMRSEGEEKAKAWTQERRLNLYATAIMCDPSFTEQQRAYMGVISAFTYWYAEIEEAAVIAMSYTVTLLNQFLTKSDEDEPAMPGLTFIPLVDRLITERVTKDVWDKVTDGMTEDEIKSGTPAHAGDVE